MINKAIVIGNMTKDPELKNLPAGTAVVNFGVATNEKWNDKATGEKREKVEYHNIVVFGKQAENVNRFTAKGSKVYVEGKLQTRSWEDKEGNKRYTTEIIANDVKFLSSNKEVNNALKNAEGKQQEYSVKTDSEFASDDIPF
jgi:single-strand DNA-binding protein